MARTYQALYLKGCIGHRATQDLSDQRIISRHHIDEESLRGEMHAFENGQLGRYLPELMDVVVGIDVPWDGEAAAPDAPNSVPNNYFPTTVPMK